MNVAYYDNVLTDEEIDKIGNPPMRYGWKASNTKSYDQGHWNSPIVGGRGGAQDVAAALSAVDYSDEFIHGSLYHNIWFNHVIPHAGPRRLARAYINGYTYGTDGYLHRDMEIDEVPEDASFTMQTCMFYLNKEWNMDWCGETVFVEDGEIVHSIIPKAGRLAVFDSLILHGARPVSRAFHGIRLVLVMKTIVDDLPISYALQTLEQMTQGIGHSGSTFFAHLKGTYNLLKQKRMSKDICLAGLFHSVYDTEFFTANLNVEREHIVELIGEKAERYAHLFCTIRPRFDQIINGDFDDETRYALAAIEHANITEQMGRLGSNDQTYLQQLEKILCR